MTLQTGRRCVRPAGSVRCCLRVTHARNRLLLLSALLSLALPAIAVPEDSIVEDRWPGDTVASTLADESTLTEYSAGSAARGDGRARLGVSFSPRFGCSPVPRLVLATELADRLDAGEGSLLSIRIDDDPLVWPVLLDRAEGELSLSFRGTERERSTLRLQIDIGEFAVLKIDDELSLTFSLLGSRRGLAAVESLCLDHEAVPWQGG